MDPRRSLAERRTVSLNDTEDATIQGDNHNTKTPRKERTEHITTNEFAIYRMLLQLPLFIMECHCFGGLYEKKLYIIKGFQLLK